MLRKGQDLKDDIDSAATRLERVEVGLNVKLYTFMSPELFKEDLVSIEGCLCPDS